MSSPRFSRRRFVSTSAAAVAGTWFGPNLLLGQNGESPNERLRIAVVGALGKGDSDTKAAAQDNEIVALCDCDSERLAKAMEGFESAKGYADFRKMLEEMEDKIDAVVVSTPDHSHFPAAMMAVGMGKHVTVQKPLCNTIWEVRELHKAAKEAGVVTQMGNQGRTMHGQRRVKEWINQGVIGTLQEIKLWTNRPIWPQGDRARYQPTEVPAHLDWDLWQAQVPHRDYSEGIHPFNWRGYWDYGSGALGDMGCHIMDATFSILDQAIPLKIEAESSEVTELFAPSWSTLVYHFAATDNYPALKVHWQDGQRDGKPNKPEKPEMMADMNDEQWGRASSGMMFIGTEGVIFEGDAYCASPIVYPLAKFEEVRAAMASGEIVETEPRSPFPGNPQREWTNAIKTGAKPSSDFDYSAPLTEFVLLGNLAIRSGETIEWDAANMRVSNVESANQYITRPAYREGWV